MKDILEPKLPKPKRWLTQPQKVLLLWISLILMFFAIYQFLSPPAPHHRAAQALSPHSWLFDYCGQILGMVVVLSAMIWGVWVARGNARFNLESAEGIALLEKGAAAQAAALFEGLIARHPHNGDAARFNAGTARLRAGQLDRAIELLTLVADEKKKASNAQTQAWAELAAAYALAGKPDEATAWLAKVEARPNVNTFALVWPRALVAARRGELVELARTLETRWRQLENTLTGNVLRRLLLLRAFAVATSEGPRGTATAEPLLARLRPTTPDEFAWLTGSWPELAAFVAANNL
jgi:tetratricopeptide (TPR) repeat protein